MRAMVAPVPGVVRSVLARPGEHVTLGQVLLELKVMEMVQKIAAPADGTVRLLLVRSGEQVRRGALLLELDS